MTWPGEGDGSNKIDTHASKGQMSPWIDLMIMMMMRERERDREREKRAEQVYREVEGEGEGLVE